MPMIIYSTLHKRYAQLHIYKYIRYLYCTLRMNKVIMMADLDSKITFYIQSTITVPGMPSMIQ